ncbi:splicing regulator SDE2 [Brachyistius frenatus]|uniref:splicing regulator SDE2 n=1 Tax=Brachyistius frenatus TaxID=100188 RepID=UPI0037E86811
MEVFVVAPSVRFCNAVFPVGSAVRDVLERFVQQQDFYVVKNGRLSDLEDPLQHGAVYHLEPRLCGGKGGFGSMLRALGAQIEKTTNREACRDLSGRRLRDVNHEKEMAEWLKKQAEREAEKEQRRLERLQRKLTEPKHQFTDPHYQQQCHDLSERLEDSVLKGLQASSGGQVKVDDVSAAKRPNWDQSGQPATKRTKKTAAAGFWTGVDELLSSEDDEEDQESPSTSSCGATAVTMTTQEEEPEPGSSSSSAGPTVRPAAVQKPPQRDQNPTKRNQNPTKRNQKPPETADQKSPETGDQKPPETGDQKPPETGDQKSPETGDQKPSETGDQKSPETGDQKPSETGDQKPSETGDQKPPETADQKSPETADQKSPETADQKSPETADQNLDVSSVSSVQQLESLGLDILKEELMSRGLKCGGTLSERAARLFSVRGLSPDQIDPALLAKPAKTRRK